MKKAIYEVSYKTGDLSKYDVLFKNVDTNDTKIDLAYSSLDGQWTHPGKKAAALFDNGNNISIKFAGLDGEDPKSLYLDPMQVEQLRLLLHAHDEANKMKRPSCYPAKLIKFTEYK
jgi:hypothetical protein